MDNITLQLTDTQRKKLLATFQDSRVDKIMNYVEYQLKVENCTITAYTSGKVVFQGKDAQVYSASFSSTPIQAKKKLVSYPTNQDMAGSDEVGTGDYFGPVCVCACIVREKDLQWLSKLPIFDSKQISDAVILEVAPILIEKLEHSKLILNNTKYNEVNQFNNMNAIKAKLHNQAYINLNKKTSLPDLCVIDQFTPSASYFRYLEYENDVFRKLHFETKAESKYIAVACASMIARYSFLMAWQSIEKHYNITLPKGASDAVDQKAASFIQQHGVDELKHIAKIHFKNTEKALSYLKK